MQIAVLADIHGNLAALETVSAYIADQQPDIVVVAGDTINRGPQPRGCWEFVQQRAAHAGWHILLGNHEEYVLDVTRDPSDRPGIEGAIRQSVRWTAAQIGDTAPIGRLAKIFSTHGPDGGEVRVTHATMRSTRDNLLVSNSDDLLREQIAPPPRVFCGGHTHVPFIKQLVGTLIMNVGSVGMPFDGDPRASFGWLESGADGWRAEVIRLPYDREQTEREFVSSGFLDANGVVGALILDEFLTARPRLFRWVTDYQPRVLAGELTVAESAELYLADLGR